MNEIVQITGHHTIETIKNNSNISVNFNTSVFTDRILTSQVVLQVSTVIQHSQNTPTPATVIIHYCRSPFDLQALATD